LGGFFVSKGELRKEVLQARAALSPAEVAAKSALIMERLIQSEAYRQASTLMVYVDFRNEAQTGDIVKRAMAAGKRVAVPVTDIANKRLTPSLLLDYPGDLAPGAWGILEPKPECLRPLAPEELDLVVVPGVAFDVDGNRLGYGGGFYDRFLPRTRPDAVFIALTFELQVRDVVFPGPHDVPMHALVTEDRFIRAGAGGAPVECGK
jgi:5-formyltetrahydrofolate cyclo-ligase